MNNVVNAMLKIQSLKNLITPIRNVVARHQFQSHRTLSYFSNNGTRNPSIAKKLEIKPTCACSQRNTHTKAAQQELVEFLTEEILAERKAQKSKTIPTEIDGFKAQLNGAEVTFTKEIANEMVKIHFNVNHSVDTDPEAEINPEAEKPDLAELKSKPSFKIDMVRNGTTVSLVCSYVSPDQQDDGYNDIFGIDEISIFNGDWNENVYSVSGEVVDSYLYDLLLNYLDEKGITNEFIEKLSDYATAYEHSAYISLLEGLSKFASGK